MPKQPLTRYSILHKTITTLIQYILTGLIQNRPVHIGIDNHEFVRDYRKYERTPFSWWQEHVAAYALIDCNMAVSSIWLRFKSKRTTDIFGTGTYLYNSQAGSFEIEVSGEGALTQMMAEFDGRTPSFISQLFGDFPSGAYPNKDDLAVDLIHSATVDDHMFLYGLHPVTYKALEID